MSTEGPTKVRVSVNKRKFAYVDFAKHRLHEGEKEIIFSGLGSAIADAVSVVELLRNQGLVNIKSIRTSRGDVEAARSKFVDKIEIVVTKSSDFDAKYEEQQKVREAAAAAKEKESE
ncbi:hypothetical protein STCU_00164 [Strigomonas culicis]|uniref:DNA/RNA-binding protein Alba-like domain-containing protein n=1 Tax=Strigomonas culicis TaxID=28005 RepID=S9V8M4_9TRYP|nr:hypothetical protein STCU_00164 [Strigomonas culicis]|eukprot:EPY37133.1 hypothetical protein STCU_00164 [Strigomonas culicis]